MKRQNVLVLGIVLLLTVSITKGQINVDTDGDVTIGDTYDATRTLDVVGDAKFTGNVGIGVSTPDATYDLYSNTAKFYGNVLFYNNGAQAIIVENGYYTKNIRPTVNHGGTLGTSSYKFSHVYADGGSWTSDIRTKENVRQVNNGLDLIKLLKPIKYDFKEEIAYQPNIEYSIIERERKEKMRKNRYGFSAQDVESFLPEIVVHDDSSDNYSIEYLDLIPILTSAIQQQQIIIDNLQVEISSLKSSSLKGLPLTGIEDVQLSEKCTLYQNAPNPFGETTSIRYSLPEGTTKADIIIYDMTGKQLKRIPLTESGASKIEVSGGEMDPGMYMYSMIVENQLIDTKQMVITE